MSDDIFGAINEAADSFQIPVEEFQIYNNDITQFPVINFDISNCLG